MDTRFHQQDPFDVTTFASDPYVLLAEDDPDLRELLSSGLRRRGYDVKTVCDGREMLSALTAIARRAELVPDVIVMDIRMPVVTGLELLRGIRLAAWRIPVIMMTGFGDKQTHALAAELGAFATLDKPLTTLALAVEIDRALDLTRGA